MTIRLKKILVEKPEPETIRKTLYIKVRGSRADALFRVYTLQKAYLA